MYSFFGSNTSQTQAPNPFTLALFSMLFNCAQTYDNTTNSNNNGETSAAFSALIGIAFLCLVACCIHWCCCGNKEESKESDGGHPATQNTALNP